MKKFALLTLGFVPFLASGCGNISNDELYNLYLHNENPSEETTEFQTMTQEIIAGYKTKNCSFNQNRKIKDAHNILWDTIDTNWGTFLTCMNNAPSVEFSCHKKQNPIKAANSLRNYDAYTTVYCKNLSGANGQAYLNIKGNNLDLDRGFIDRSSPRRIASVIAHEIMHNRGYSHSKNAFGSQYYPNTIPEQIEACIRYSGSPNSSAGAKTVTWSDEFCNGLKTGNLVSRKGMHACPLGTYMAGVRLDNNEFLCSTKPNNNYYSGEIIRKKGGYAEFGMANCPKGYAMSGFHKNKNYLLCAPYRKASRSVDKSTSRAGMHTCPKNKVMTGIHVKRNDLTCQY